MYLMMIDVFMCWGDHIKYIKNSYFGHRKSFNGLLLKYYPIVVSSIKLKLITHKQFRKLQKKGLKVSQEWKSSRLPVKYIFDYFPNN